MSVKFYIHRIVRIGLVAIVIVSFYVVYELVINNEGTVQPSIVALPETASAETQVEPGLPDKLIIPSLNINARILAMGLEKSGKMDVPDNYVDIGWFGARPGTVGSAVLGAHVDNGGEIPGAFKNLKKLEAGDDIHIIDEAGNTLHFKVVQRKVYGYKEKSTEEVFLLNDKPRLNLITCTGNWLSKENTYDQRIVIFAELESIDKPV